MKYVQWEPNVSIKVMCYSVADARIYWQLDDIAAIVGFSEQGRKRLGRDLGRTWISALSEYGVPMSDYVFAHGSEPYKTKEQKEKEKEQKKEPEVTMEDEDESPPADTSKAAGASLGVRLS